MARKTYKRRRTRKRAPTKRYRRKRTYRKKAKTSTGKLWKYVKKATKSEVKRCDALYPPNFTYTTAQPTGSLGALLKPESRFLYRIAFKNNGVTETSDFGSHDAWMYDGQWRFWHPYQLTFDIRRGELSNQRVGDKVFAKYVNLKIQFYSANRDTRPHHCALYFVQIARSVSGAYTGENIMDAIWDGMANFCRSGHMSEIYDGDNSGSQIAQYRALMQQSYAQKRKRYLKGIKVKRLHSYHSNSIMHMVPSYTMSNFNERWSMSFNGTPTSSGWSASGSLVRPSSTQTPTYAPGDGPFLPEERTVHNYISKLIPLNKEWKYAKVSDDSETGNQGLDEYKYYLIALSSDYHPNLKVEDLQEPGDPDCVYYVSGELVYSDK